MEEGTAVVVMEVAFGGEVAVFVKVMLRIATKSPCCLAVEGAEGTAVAVTTEAPTEERLRFLVAFEVLVQAHAAQAVF